MKRYYALEIAEKLSDQGPDLCDWDIVEAAEKELVRLFEENQKLRGDLMTIKFMASSSEDKHWMETEKRKV